MKLLFLDMDGVLNHHGSTYRSWRLNGKKCVFLGWEHLCPISCSNLEFVLDKIPDMKVVISSTWRLHHEWEEWNTNKYLLEECPSIAGRVIGKTPALYRGFSEAPRGTEILEYLSETGNQKTPFVVLDDNTDMPGVEENFIHVDECLGFTYRDAVKVLKHFGVDER